MVKQAAKRTPRKATTGRSPAPTTPDDLSRDEDFSERGDKISEIIARQIVRDIARRNLQPGTTLPAESVMLQRFRVGRASLREALRILEVYGLIAIRPGPGGGPVVQAVTSRQFARTSTFYFHLHGATFGDLLDARRAIEPMMARLAAGGRDQGGLDRLGRDVAAARAAMEAGDEDTWRRLTSEFHVEVAGASGNHILDLFGQSLKDLYSERLESRVIGRGDAKRVQKEHEAIHKAIVEGRAAQAERLMADHMATFTSITSKAIPGLLDDVLDWR